MATSDGNTVIGESILVNGHLHGDEDLTVRGRVEGTLTLTKRLVVEATGVVKAQVQAKSCVISGVLAGDVTASESVEITKDGRMVGDIRAPRVIIVDGAGFRGRIDMGEMDVAAVEGPERALARPAPRPLLRPAPARGDREEARNGEERQTPPEKAAAARPPPPPAPVAMAAMKRKVVVRRK